MVDPSASEASSIEVIVDDVLFQSADGRFAVVRVERTQSTDLASFVAVGDLGQVAEGEILRIEGRATRHPVHGERFRVDSFTPVMPESQAGMTRFLGSGLIDGVGPALAARIVERFGDQTLEIIATQSAKLTEVSGVGKKRAQALSEAVRGRRAEAEQRSFLHGLGLGPSATRRFVTRFGEDTVRALRDDPYLASERVSGVGFRTADRIAHSLGIEKDDPRRAAGAVLHLIARGVDDGHVYGTREVLEQSVSSLDVSAALVEDAVSTLTADGLLVDDDGRLYPPPLFEAERRVARRLARLAAPRRPPATLDRALEAAAAFALSEAQQRAVATSLGAGLMVLTGGPGTGKTTTVRAIVAAHQALERRVLLAAPTGRAAKRLAETTGAEAKTIHRLLEWNPGTGGFQRRRDNPLDAETILIDEASMLDLHLGDRLLAAVPDAARLILVGDVDQLPPVGAGQVLRALIASDIAESHRLEEVFRQAAQSAIVRGAHQVLRGALPASTSSAERGEGDLFVIARNDPSDIIETLLKTLARVGPGYGLDPRTDVQILSPMRRGPLGTEALNRLLQHHLNPAPGAPEGALRPLDKVMQQRNDYDRDVYNGDVGEVDRVEGGTVYVHFDGREVQYPPDAQDALSLAYASTVHKVQGSEFPAVILVMHPSQHILLSRPMLYTGLTRAKRLAVLLGDPRAFERAAGNAATSLNRSHLRQRLLEAAEGGA